MYQYIKDDFYIIIITIYLFILSGGMVWLGLLRDPTKSLMVDEDPFFVKTVDSQLFYFSTLLLIPSSLVAALLLPDMFLKTPP